VIEFELTFEGGLADEGLLEFYDAARALAGFQRSLALTAHLAINGEIITQAPAARGFQIFVPPFQEGSWKTRAKLAIGAALAMGSVGKDSPVGHLVTSLYDAVLFNTMGFHVDYDKTLQVQFLEHFESGRITAEKVDSLSEKIESSVAEMHRPIVVSKTATRGWVTERDRGDRDVGPLLSEMTFEFVRQTKSDENPTVIEGYVSSYNINTFTGRIYSLEERRPIPFELAERARTKRNIGILTTSQHLNGQVRFDPKAKVQLECYRLTSPNGKVKRYLVVAATPG
jgi:hypothetical protein